jgi:hypothetical protein
LADPIDHSAAKDWEEVPEPSEQPAASNGSPLRAVPGLIRIGTSAGWRTAEWTLNAYLEAISRLMRAAAAGESAAELFERTGDELRGYLRGLLGLLDGNVPEGPVAAPEAAPEAGDSSNGTIASLRERGAELLRRSADIHYEEETHPAYERILENLAPDEARILRLLAIEGPQPAVDVRTARPFGVGSELVAPGLTMIAEAAGCRRLDNLRAYLNNLYRLGLIWFSREPVGDHLRYQVLEAQPDVQAAMEEAGRGRTVRRSIHLTPFGEDFCQTCLPIDTAEIEALRAEAVRD